MISISWAMQHAKYYYDKKTYEHALRVMGYVSEMWIIPNDEERDYCMSLALMHDLVEDTNFSLADIPPEDPTFKRALELLTKPKDIGYVEYCKKIKDETYTRPGRYAYWVKLADMKDHLNQKETLTDRLKEKYLEGMAELL